MVHIGKKKKKKPGGYSGKDLRRNSHIVSQTACAHFLYSEVLCFVLCWRDELPFRSRSLVLADLESEERRLTVCGPDQQSSCAFVWSAPCLKAGIFRQSLDFWILKNVIWQHRAWVPTQQRLQSWAAEASCACGWSLLSRPRSSQLPIVWPHFTQGISLSYPTDIWV